MFLERRRNKDDNNLNLSVERKYDSMQESKKNLRACIRNRCLKSHFYDLKGTNLRNMPIIAVEEKPKETDKKTQWQSLEWKKRNINYKKGKSVAMQGRKKKSMAFQHFYFKTSSQFKVSFKIPSYLSLNFCKVHLSFLSAWK